MSTGQPITVDTMDTLNRLADIAAEIDELKAALSADTVEFLGFMALLLHEAVEREAGDRAVEIYGIEDAPL